MNMQNTLYKIQFSHHATTDFAASPQAVIAEPGFCEFCKIPQKAHIKVWTPEQ